MLTQEQKDTLRDMQKKGASEFLIATYRKYYERRNDMSEEALEEFDRHCQRNAEPQPPDAILYAPERRVVNPASL